MKFDQFSTPETHPISKLEIVQFGKIFSVGSIVVYTNSSGTEYQGVIIEKVDLTKVKIKFDQFSNPEIKSAGSTFVSSWSSTMEFYVTFNAETDKITKNYVGYIQFNEKNCRVIRSEFKQLHP